MLPVALAAMSVLLAGWALMRLPALHPLQLWTVPWAVATTLFSLHLLPYRPMTPGTMWLIAATTLSYAFGVIVGARFRPEWAVVRPGTPSDDIAHEHIARAAGLSLVLLALWLALFIVQASLRYGMRATFVSSSDVRLDLGAGALGFAIKYVYAALAAAALCGVAAATASSSRTRSRWLIALGASAFTAYFSTGRSTIVLAALGGMLAYGVAGPINLPPRRMIAGIFTLGALTLAVFLVGGAVIGKNITSADVGTVRSPFTDHPALATLALPYEYASAPIAALNVQVGLAKPLGRAHGCATFAVVCQVLRAAGLPLYPEPSLPPLTASPLRWNTYTALEPPLADWGPGFVLLWFVAAASIVGGVWRAATNGGTYAILIYSIVGTAVVYAPTQNNFLAPHIVGAVALSVALVAVARSDTFFHLSHMLATKVLDP